MDGQNVSQAVASNRSPVLNDVWNVPNVLTIARLVLSVVCFVTLTLGWFLPSLVLFAIAAGTDWVDGFYARRYGQITQLGRILDPFADKIIICGTFTFLAAVPPDFGSRGLDASASEIWAWMAVVVVAREILVTALRSFFEEHGSDFSAKWSGKWKRVFKCAAVAMSLWRLWSYQFGSRRMSWGVTPPASITWTLRLLVWTAVIMTIYSGWVYVRRALDLMRS